MNKDEIIKQLQERMEKGDTKEHEIKSNIKTKRKGNIIYQLTKFEAPDEITAVALMMSMKILKNIGTRIPNFIDAIKQEALKDKKI